MIPTREVYTHILYPVQNRTFKLTNAEENLVFMTLALCKQLLDPLFFL
jgi:hypothetical protein